MKNLQTLQYLKFFILKAEWIDVYPKTKILYLRISIHINEKIDRQTNKQTSFTLQCRYVDKQTLINRYFMTIFITDANLNSPQTMKILVRGK